MKNLYIFLLILLLSSITAIAVTYFQVLNDKKEFILNLDKIFDGQEVVSDGLEEGIYTEFKMLDSKIDGREISALSFGRSPATATINKLFSFKLQVLKKFRLISGEFDGSYNLDSITQEKPIYFGSINPYFQANFENDVTKASARGYQNIVKTYGQNLVDGKYRDIVDFPFTKSQFYFLKRYAEIKTAKPGESNSIANDIGEYRIFATRHMINYKITPDNKEIAKKGIYNLLWSVLFMILLSTTIFLLTKIFKK